MMKIIDKFIDWEDEYLKCQASPYYFATKYLRIKTDHGSLPFTTKQTEETFNQTFRRIEILKNEIKTLKKHDLENKIRS